MTANPLRPHYDATLPQVERIFLLQDEPPGEASYSLLACYREQGAPRFTILHGVTVRPDGSLPEHILAQVQTELIYWIACPPLLIGREYREGGVD